MEDLLLGFLLLEYDTGDATAVSSSRCLLNEISVFDLASLVDVGY